MVVPSGAPRLKIHRFEVTGVLGSGAMGTVYRARDPQLQREVAIKVLARPAPAARSALASFDTVDLRGGTRDDLLAEAQIMARLSHPNVLPVYEVGLAEGGLFVVMEYVAGSDLRTWLTTPRPTAQILDVFAQAAAGLAAAHAQGVVHRDFKPENVLVGDDRRVRVADFGLSSLVARAAPLLREQAIGGTPYYMAPELWTGGAASERSDSFALCTALAEALGNEPADRAALDRTLRARGCNRRLRAALAAGLADEPLARPALPELIAALGPRRVPRRVWLAGGAVAAAAAVVIALVTLSGDPACQADQLRFSPPDPARRAQLAAIGAADIVDRYYAGLEDARRAACTAERRGEITSGQALGRASCLERRVFELETATDHLLAEQPPPSDAADHLGMISGQASCAELVAPPLPADRAAVRALFARLVAAERMPIASGARTAALATIEHDARALGERELESHAAVSLGMRQIETDDLVAADASFARAYDLSVAIHGRGIALTALVERAVAAEQRGDPAAARTWAKLAVEVADKPNTPARRKAAAYWALARAEQVSGNSAAAVELSEKTLEILEEPGARDPFREMNVRNTLISALETLGGGREVRALELARQNLELSRQVEGERDPDHGIALNIVAIALRYNGDAEAALAYRRRAWEVISAGLPADHSNVMLQRMDVANDLWATGQFEAARKAALVALASVGDNARVKQYVAAWTADLGRYTFSTGATAEGMRLVEQGVDEVISQDGGDRPNTLEYRATRLGLELELGRLDDVERHADALERSYRSRRDQAIPLARLDGILRAELALARRRPRDAEARARTALAAWSELRGSDDDRVDLLRILGASLVDQRRWREAVAELDRATALARARKGLDDRFARIDLERARALFGLGRPGEARALVRGARKILVRFPGELRARAAAAALARR